MSKRRRDEDGAGVAEAAAVETFPVSQPATETPVKPHPMVRSAVAKLRTMWVATQPATQANVGGVELTRDEAAVVYDLLPEFLK